MADDGSVTRLIGAYIRLIDQRGQTMAEYAILLGIIALVVVTGAFLLGGSISSIFSKTSAHL